MQRRGEGRSVAVWAVLIISSALVIILVVFKAAQAIRHVVVSRRQGPPVVTLKTLGLDSAKLIFVSNRSGSYQIYEKNLAAGTIRALTNGPSNNMNPQLSPDGTRLVFYSDRTGSNQIYMLSLNDPTKVTRLTNDNGGVNAYDPVFTPDARSILYKRTDADGNFGDIWEMDVDGSNGRDLTPELTKQGVEGWKPTLVSSNQAIITERLQQHNPYSDNLYSLDLKTGVTKALTSNALTNWFPDYNPKTGDVVFVTKRFQDDHDVLATMPIRGKGRDIIVDMAGDSNDPAWSTDNRHLVFLNDRGTGYFDIYAAWANGNDTLLIDKGPLRSSDLSPILVT